MLDTAKFMTDLHRQHVAAELGNLDATREALRLAIICAANELDVATGLDVEDLTKGLTFKAPPNLAPECGTTSDRQTLSEFLEAFPAN